MDLARSVSDQLKGSPNLVGCERMSSGYSNANYRMETDRGVFLLRHCMDQRRSEVEYEIRVLDWLRAHGFPAPAALRFSGGNGWLVRPDGTHLMVLEWLDGSEPAPVRQNVITIARALGDLHCLPPPAGDWWRRENPLGGPLATDLLESKDPDVSPLHQCFIEEFCRLRDGLAVPLPRGFIHGDVFPDNTLFNGDELVAILDFECSCEEALLFDVAMTIHGFCFVEEEWNSGLADALIAAYAERRPLSPAEQEALPTYLQWCALAMMGWHVRQRIRRPSEANEKRASDFARRLAVLKEYGLEDHQ